MEASRFLKLSVIFLLVATILIPKAHGEIEAYTFSMNKKYNLETLAKFVVIYEYSNQFSGSTNATGYTISHLDMSPTKAVFWTEETDEYKVTITIKYTAPITQTLSYSVFSGEKVLGGDDIPLFVRSITLSLLITTSKPASQNETVNPVLKEIGNLRGDIENYRVEDAKREQLQTVGVYFSVFGVVVVILYLFIVSRRRT